MNEIRPIFSKIHARRFKPYYRFTEKKFIIVGSFTAQEHFYLVFKDSKNKQYKISLTNKIDAKITIPSFIVFNETYLSAKNLIGKMAGGKKKRGKKKSVKKKKVAKKTNT